MREAVRESDPDRPVVLGIDAETLFHETRIDARAALAHCEVAVSHPTARYRSYAAEGPVTATRSTFLDSYLLHSTSRARPVLLDDIGPHGLEISHAEEAAMLRCALYSGLMNGASGAFVRRWRDMRTEPREPYFVDPFEALVGVCDSDGRAKAARRELDLFARMIARLDLRRYARTPERAAVLIPSQRTASLPTLGSLYAPRICLEAFVRAKQAHLPVTLTREEDSFEPFSMLIVPSVTDLAEGTWQRVAAWVQGGGSLVFSYGGGEFGPEARDLFGVDFLGHGGARTKATCRIAQQGVLGQLEPFEVAADIPHFALLGPGASTVVATDAAGSPLVTLSRPGQGRAICVAAPFERVLGQSGLRTASAELAAFLRTLYGAVADVSGCGPKVACDAPEVEIALLAGDGEDVVFLLDRGGKDVTAALRFEQPVATVAPVSGGTPVTVGGEEFGVPLGPFGAVALKVCYR
jgi:endo-1,4-beta-mannosidase